MAFILDTSVAIQLRDDDSAILDKVAALNAPLFLSIVTRVELEGGIYRDPRHTALKRIRLDALLSGVPTLAFNDAAARAYGEIIAAAGYSRRKILDRMIAAQAIVNSATLVSFNAADFSDVPNLKFLAW